jgi:hypothetical protein
VSNSREVTLKADAVTRILEKLTAIDEKLRTLILVTEDNGSSAGHEGSAAEREEPTQRSFGEPSEAEYVDRLLRENVLTKRGEAYTVDPSRVIDKEGHVDREIYFKMKGFGYAYSPAKKLFWKPKEKKQEE